MQNKNIYACPLIEKGRGKIMQSEDVEKVRVVADSDYEGYVVENYDATKNERTFILKKSIKSLGEAYTCGFNFNGKTVRFTLENAIFSAREIELLFVNGHKISIENNPSFKMSIYDPYTGGNEFELNASNTYTGEYTFRDGTDDIGTDCTISLIRADGVEMTADEFDSVVHIVIE